MNPNPERNRRLSLPVIIDVAVELIRSEGFDALSMRRLAQQCGVGVMTLYGYVRTKEELMTAIADQLLAEVEEPAAALSWQDQLKAIFRSTHRIFLQHPELTEIVARQHLNARSAFRGAEFAFAAMERAGLDLQRAMSAFVTLASFTAGFSQRQMHAQRSAAIDARRLASLRELPAEKFAHVSQLALAFVSGLTDQRFEDGLDLIIRGIAAGAAA